MKTSPPRGMQDFLNLRLEKTIENLLNRHFLLQNFQQIQTPIIETLDLFLRCVGQDTDVVNKEMFLLQSRDDENLCLRPELTAPTFRAFLNSDIQNGPWKVFSCGSMFRYERPQKGRWRQFDQFNVEIIDAKNLSHDIALIELFDRAFRQLFKLQDIVLHLNFLGNPTDRQQHRVALIQFLRQQQQLLCVNCVARTETNPLRCFDCKNEACQAALDQAPLLQQFLSPESQREWQTLQDGLHLLEVNFIVDPRLVRGLDYYNGVVFEFKSNLLGAQNTFCGGGRYDLSEPFGLKQTYPSVGAAIGVGRLALMLQEANLLPDISLPELHLVLPLKTEFHPLALMLARMLANAGLRADVLLEDCSMSNLFKKANRLEAQTVLLLGPDEVANNQVVIKNMLSGAQKTVTQDLVVDALKTMSH